MNTFKLGLMSLLFINTTSVFASPIDDRVKEFTNITTISPVTYQGMPVRADAGELCSFLGYSLALESTDYSVKRGETIVDFNIGKTGLYEFAPKTALGDHDLFPLASLTCARR